MTVITSTTGRPSEGLAIGSVHMPIVPTWPQTAASQPADDGGSRRAASAPPASVPPAGVLRAALFALDDVLYDATHWQRWLWQLLSHLGVQRDFENFRRIWQRGYLVEAQRGSRDFADAFRAFLVDWGLSAGQIDEVTAASIARRRETFQNVRPLPGVVKTLDALGAAGLGLAVLANSELPSAEIQERIERLGLAGRFQTVLSSRDLGFVKPELACYQAALDALNLAPDAVLYIGCSTDELAGAAAVGMRTAAINATDSTHADYQLQQFDDLLAICVPKAAAAANA